MHACSAPAGERAATSSSKSQDSVQDNTFGMHARSHDAGTLTSGKQHACALMCIILQCSASGGEASGNGGHLPKGAGPRGIHRARVGVEGQCIRCRHISYAHQPDKWRMIIPQQCHHVLLQRHCKQIHIGLWSERPQWALPWARHLVKQRAMCAVAEAARRRNHGAAAAAGRLLRLVPGALYAGLGPQR